ncbi:MAG: homogentisate 1,2-dioxygenase [Deltaproteobacteria bacterium]|nr:homogentisate 1,2-dioxygenase [Deltaproteobacteria bacterium]
MTKALNYLSGFGNEFASEALEGVLPKGQNSPQKCPYGLYAEQLSGTSFTAPRASKKRSWLYRILPSAAHPAFGQVKQKSEIRSAPFDERNPTPNQLRWDPFAFPKESHDFVEGLFTVVGNGDVRLQTGCAIHIYCVTRSMKKTCFYNADGDFLIVPQEGVLLLRTEFGVLEVGPGEIAVISRGMKFLVELKDSKARGYICENYGAHFTLPELGPIGANGLANPRDFLTPIASYSDKPEKWDVLCKFQGVLWQTTLDHDPFDVVAWHGNYVPYKYNLKYFQTMNTVSFDHGDPSIFTVLTSPSSEPGVANIDFVIFPDRWMVAEHTFRPPYYHRNVMSEFMGLVYGAYDAKEEGFLPGGASLHNATMAHGPDAKAFQQATEVDLKPQYYSGTLAFMFESRYVFSPTGWAMKTPALQKDYHECWQDLKSYFNPKSKKK